MCVNFATTNTLFVVVYLWCSVLTCKNNTAQQQQMVLSHYYSIIIIDYNYYRSSVIKQFDLAKDVQWNYEMVSGKS
jgi:uncharacterized membrane protein YozB (DUF420 family)